MSLVLNSYRLFLDDIRDPRHCLMYMQGKGFDTTIYNEKWEIVRSHKAFVEIVEKQGLPSLISFDHDLADEHYIEEDPEYGEYTEKTGYDSAKWLVQYCLDNNLKLPYFIVHSMNPIGKQNITTLLTNFKNQQK